MTTLSSKKDSKGVTTAKVSFLSETANKELEHAVEVLMLKYLVKYRKKFIEEYISSNFSKFMGENRPLTSQEVMDILLISRQTLSRWIKEGKIKPINSESGRHYRFKRDDIDRLIEEGM